MQGGEVAALEARLFYLTLHLLGAKISFHHQLLGK